jgi:hypothetical protein
MTTEITLYEVEERYQALLDTETLVAPDLEEQFKRELTDALRQRGEKRDRVLHVILDWDSRVDAIDREVERLKRYKEVIKNARRRLGKHILDSIRDFGVDSKGKFRKLDASLGTMYARALPESLEIVDEAIIPDEYMTVRVDVPLEVWRTIKEHAPGIEPKQMFPDREKLTAAPKERDVPGADLKLSGHDYTLVVTPGVARAKKVSYGHTTTEKSDGDDSTDES